MKLKVGITLYTIYLVVSVCASNCGKKNPKTKQNHMGYYKQLTFPVIKHSKL